MKPVPMPPEEMPVLPETCPLCGGGMAMAALHWADHADTMGRPVRYLRASERRYVCGAVIAAKYGSRGSWGNEAGFDLIDARWKFDADEGCRAALAAVLKAGG